MRMMERPQETCLGCGEELKDEDEWFCEECLLELSEDVQRHEIRAHLEWTRGPQHAWANSLGGDE